jgi:hypothetical protein
MVTVSEPMEVKPRPFGEILNEGMAMLGKVWRKILVPAFWAFVVLGVATIAVFALTGADDAVQLILTDPLALDEMSDAEVREIALVLLQAGLTIVVVQALAGGFVNMAVHRIVAGEIVGESVGAGAASSFAFGRMLTLVASAVLAMIVVLIGLLALIIPGLWLIGSFSMLTAVIALEEAGPVDALRRSMTLVRGRWWPTVGFLIVVGLLGSVAAQLVQLIALPIIGAGGAGLTTGLGFVLLVVAQGIVVAAIAVMVTLWYFDLRARKEPVAIPSPQ